MLKSMSQPDRSTSMATRRSCGVLRDVLADWHEVRLPA